MSSANSDTNTSFPVNIILPGLGLFLLFYGLLVYGFVTINRSMRVTDGGPEFTKGLQIILGMNSTIVIILFAASAFLPGINERLYVKLMVLVTFFISLTAIAIGTMRQTTLKVFK
jgi:hypothetical protein